MLKKGPYHSLPLDPIPWLEPKEKEDKVAEILQLLNNVPLDSGKSILRRCKEELESFCVIRALDEKDG